MFFKKNRLRKYRQKLKNIKYRYEKKMQNQRKSYISTLVHDIKTPILAQKQALETVLENYSGDYLKNKSLIEEIANSNSFLLEVVKNLIFLAKYENGLLNLNLENIDIIEQIKDCAALIEDRAKNKSQTITIKSNKNQSIKVNADRILIQKIIFNLLIGSINYGFENSDIELLIRENKNSVSFCAKNKSVYMSKEKINSLFEEEKNLHDFNQLGMKLNLSVAKKLINAHKWDIIAKSDKNNSSVFGFIVKK